VISELRKPPLRVAQGTTEAATAHIRVAVQQLRPGKHQLAYAPRVSPIDYGDGLSGMRSQLAPRKYGDASRASAAAREFVRRSDGIFGPRLEWGEIWARLHARPPKKVSCAGRQS
jgi:hypothetical protein